MMNATITRLAISSNAAPVICLVHTLRLMPALLRSRTLRQECCCLCDQLQCVP
ncbi:hypothetical protein UVIVOLLU_CDS0063 [Salmonella phage PHA46_2]